MKVVISFKGKQYLVSENDQILTEKVIGKKGKKIKINDVLLISNNNDVKIGKPIVKNSEVQAELIGTAKAKKKKIIKFKAKKRYQIIKGHRQLISRVKITKILTRIERTKDVSKN